MLSKESIPGTSLTVSKLALGGWLTFGDRLADGDSFRLLETAVDGGINFIDLADVYTVRSASAYIGYPYPDESRDRNINGQGGMMKGA